ncbi:hypothetical protein CVT26_013702 [Gymnopilus dilepis]|uniref:SAM-dependent MTase RsmB/NOP-type domain-containing protein n=1 Tax=Gymnopilus dilepis TaxID=231916 RepID=A0A409YWI1_9AGAR|nr:hypothetical protein CVT26_013702 [Gymnopilus dilepis]
MNNERFFAYYKAQNIVSEAEWPAFVEALRQHLPTTFRVAGSRQCDDFSYLLLVIHHLFRIAKTLNSMIKELHVPSLSDVVFEGQKIPPPVQLPWYPDGLAWQFNVPKKVLRKSPEFKKFHSFLVFETEVGNISRQEAVSMLPPLFLDVEPHHKVMDMCAAPGSKTAQILEALHAQDTETATSIPSGLLLANDSDNKRTHLLIHQSARLPSPALMVTNLDASNYPSIKVPLLAKNGSSRLGQLLFDRILCDVPCSGDGTIRKNMGIWKSWQPMDGNGLHALQVRILLRAMNLLEEDGLIVYSTCSLNPVENEAVVAEALKSNTAFELVDVSSKLPHLDRRPGLTSWRATADRTGATTFATYEDFMKSSVDDSLKAKMSEGHWPPQDAESLNLQRCMRIYPHLQDTGGFFVAVLKRTPKIHTSAPSKERKREADAGDLPSETPDAKRLKTSAEVPPDQEARLPVVTADSAGPVPVDTELETSTVKANSKKKVKDGGSFKENPYTFLSPDDPILRSCIERLHITKDFPSSNVLVRNPEGEAARSLYLANDLVKTVIESNNYERIRLTAAGTKVFAKQEAGKGAEAQFRVLGEGLPVIIPFIDPAHIIVGDTASLKTLVESHYPLCSSFVEPFRSLVEARPTGSHVVRFPLETQSYVHDLLLPIWKSNVSVTLMIDKKAKSALSLRLYGTDITNTAQEGRLVANLQQNVQEEEEGSPLETM